MTAPTIAEIQAAFKEESGKYRRALGEMFVNWAETEGVLYRVMLHYARLPEMTGRAIFPGTRASGMVTILDRLFADSKFKITAARRADLKFITAQIGAINTMRDRLAHHGAVHVSLLYTGNKSEGFQYITNTSRSITEASAYRIRVDTALVMSMSVDLTMIRDVLSRHLSKGRFTLLPESGDAATWR